MAFFVFNRVNLKKANEDVYRFTRQVNDDACRSTILKET